MSLDSERCESQTGSTALPPQNTQLPLNSLWPSIQATTVSALKSGALHSISTTFERVDDHGIPFLVRQLANLERKVLATAPTTHLNPGVAINPFLPPEPDLVVAEITDTHICVLNKFNVVEHHSLLITREFESQDAALTLADFTALAICWREFSSLAFYNSGKVAGASQRHKHLQLVPLPLSPLGERIPLEESFSTAFVDEVVHETAIATIPTLPFQHGLIRLESLSPDPFTAGQQLYDSYGKLLRVLGLAALPEYPDDHPAPYNLLATREWMFVVPRSQESFQGVAINALGFAGTLLVRNLEQLDFVKQVGPLNILAQVAKQ